MQFQEIDFRPYVMIATSQIQRLFEVCTPKLLVVADDNLNFSSSGFGLTQFISTLESSTIYGMTPKIVKAHRYQRRNADIKGFRFDDEGHGLKKSGYDVVFLFGFEGEGSALPQSEVDAIAEFMESGGGVFATGDHEDLGAGMSKDVPRVRNMRYWLREETPNASNSSRLSTNLAGDNGIYEFDDQSDVYPQRIYVNYRTQSGGVGKPHPLLQVRPQCVVDVLPDHPHEGECRIPKDLNTSFTLNCKTVDEWPKATNGNNRVSPEMVALAVSHGSGIGGKAALEPRAFMAIVAYDGDQAGVGRVSTDATWHHFININIDGTDTDRNGLQNPPGTDTPEMTRIREYYKNIASWLMPKKRRRCLRYHLIIQELGMFPLFEEIRIPELADASGKQFYELGESLVLSLQHKLPHWTVESLIKDALEDAIGEERVAKLLGLDEDFERLSDREIGLVAFGGTLVGVAMAMEKIELDQETLDLNQFDSLVKKAASTAVKKFQDRCLGDV